MGAVEVEVSHGQEIGAYICCGVIALLNKSSVVWLGQTAVNAAPVALKRVDGDAQLRGQGAGRYISFGSVLVRVKDQSRWDGMKFIRVIVITCTVTGRDAASS